MEFRFVFIWLRLRNSKPPAPQASCTCAIPEQEGRCTHTATGDCWWNNRRVAAVKIRQIAILTSETIGILRVALCSRSPDIRPRKSSETTPICRVNVAMLQYSNASADETRLACITDSMAVSRRRHQFIVMLPRTLDKRVRMLKLNSRHRLSSPLPNPLT